MRNGNFDSVKAAISSNLVLTVPMRNGNYPVFKKAVNIALRSYRTYEEWKHDQNLPWWQKMLSSYRTYEEWKRNGILNAFKTSWGSYRTYEEWKLVSAQLGLEPGALGSYRTYEEWKHSLLYR